MRLIPVTNQHHAEWLRIQRNRPELMKYFRQSKSLMKREQQRWWKNLNRKNVRLFIVEDKGHWCGYVGLNPIDWRHNHAEFGIFIVPEFQKRNVGKRALTKLLRYAFTELGLHKVYSDVIDYKNSRIKFFTELGFKIEGINRGHYFKGGSWRDSIQIGMLKKELRSK